jgi:multidrug resistance efflux pump
MTVISAHEGHDHGLPPPMPVTAPLSPRVTAESAEILDAVDRTDLQAELDGRIENVARNLNRLRQLGDNAPRQELEETETDHTSLSTRRQAIADSFNERLPLTAAVGGVLVLRNASPGQIVAGGETLFTVVDPQRLLVEALLYDTDHATHFTSASAMTVRAVHRLCGVRLG